MPFHALLLGLYLPEIQGAILCIVLFVLRCSKTEEYIMAKPPLIYDVRLYLSLDQCTLCPQIGQSSQDRKKQISTLLLSTLASD